MEKFRKFILAVLGTIFIAYLLVGMYMVTTATIQLLNNIF